MASKKQSLSEKSSGAKAQTLKPKQVVIGLVVILALVGAISSCGGSSSKKSSSSDSSSAAVVADTTQYDPDSFFDSDRAQSLAQCENYFTLINRGWTTDQIIGELKNAGAFDNMPGGVAVYHRLIKWCYAND
jgi:hypothetical protein